MTDDTRVQGRNQLLSNQIFRTVELVVIGNIDNGRSMVPPVPC